jgi:thiol-disulfide isomerase/thioredoxin
MSERRPAAGVPLHLAAALTVCLLAGCEPTSNRENYGGRSPERPAVGVRGDVQIAVVDRDGYNAVIAAHHGKVALIDFWATWCGPCIEQLPHTIALAERFAARGLAVVTVSLDDPDESQRIVDFLQSKGAGRVTNLISQHGASPQSMSVFEIGSGAVPHYKLYDREGQLRHTFGIDPSATKQFTLGDIDDAIEHLLSE